MNKFTRAAALALALGAAACGGSGTNNAQAPTSLSYASNPAVYTAGTAIAPNAPRSGGDAATYYSISPALPAGLTLSPTTGILAGTPNAVAPATAYLVLAGNSGGTTSAALSIAVNPPAAPVIVTQPATQILQIGQAASFNVVATGTGTLTYQWSRNGVALPGQTATTYTTAAITYLDDDTTFTVAVADSFGTTVTSRAAKLRIEGFIDTGPMSVPRQSHAASRLATDGKVLVSGGFSIDVLASVDVFDPLLGTFTSTGSLLNARQNHTSNLLGNGKVLVAGGQGGVAGGLALASAETYDPGTGTFSLVGPMAGPRFFHSATLLPDGKVLVVGGRASQAGRDLLATAEVFDPGSNTFTATGSMSEARYWHTATLLANGKVLVTGGYGITGGPLASAEIYDPGNGHFTSTGSMRTARYGQTATLIPSTGKVLVAGGYGSTYLDSAELYDPVAETFEDTGSLTYPRYFQTATALPGGKVLVAGGMVGGYALATAELFDPVLATFVPTGSMEAERYMDTATLLDTGEVLVAGGWSLGNVGLDTAELYSGVP
jgi:hypothetical protein